MLQRCATRTTIGGKRRAWGMPPATEEEYSQPASPVARGRLRPFRTAMCEYTLGARGTFATRRTDLT
eukprot:scaffold903_cov249-Prasinococcus_capsulatus_cf.AAC.1